MVHALVMANAIPQTVRFSVDGAEYTVSWVVDPRSYRSPCTLVQPDGSRVSKPSADVLEGWLADNVSEDAADAFTAALAAFATTDEAVIRVFGGYAIRDALKASGAIWHSLDKCWLARRSDVMTVLTETGATLKTGSQFEHPSTVWVAE